jgi:hypothetical protein
VTDVEEERRILRERLDAVMGGKKSVPAGLPFLLTRSCVQKSAECPLA